LETFLEKNNVTGLKTLSDELEQELGYYVKLFLIMYADDTALSLNDPNLLNFIPRYKKSFTISNSLYPYLK
jgi:hypothetical protein